MKRIAAMMMVLIMMFSMATMNAFGMVAMAEPVETTTSQVKDNPGTGDNSILPWAIGGGAIVRNKNAGVADSVADKVRSATCSPLGARCGAVRNTSCGQRGGVANKT